MLAIYCRHSKPKEESKDTAIPTQKLYGIQLAESLGMEYDFYIDKGISGTSIDGRDGMQKLVTDIKSKKISAVYAYDQSRIERDTSFWLEFCSLVVDNGVRYFENTKEIDLTDPTNVMNTTMQSAFSAYYAAQTSVKVKESIKRNAEKGKVRGILPYGYIKDSEGFVIKHPEQAKVVELIYELSLGGMGTYSISNVLNEQNIPTKFHDFEGEIKRKADKYKPERKFKKSEVRWRGNVIYDMIKNEAYKGIKRVGKLIVNIPPIVDDEKWIKALENLEKNKKNVGPKAQYHYLLNGLVYCHHCGRPVIGKKRLKGRDNAYKCTGKRYPNPDCNESRGLSIPKLETFIIKMLFESYDLTEYFLNLPEKEGKIDLYTRKLIEAQKDLQEVKKIISNTDHLITKAPPERQERFLKILDENERKQKQLNETIIALEVKIDESTKSERDKILKQVTTGYKKDLSFDELKDLVHMVIEKIVVKHIHKEKGEVEKSHHQLYIKYKGFEEEMLVSTKNHDAYMWSGMVFQNVSNVKEMEPDNMVIDWDAVANAEVLTMPIHSYILQLKEDKLILFD
jgi:site-specific DNA recombinase